MTLSACQNNVIDNNEEIIEKKEEDIPSFDYKLNPHVLAKEYKLIYGNEFENKFYNFCDVILNNQNEFNCHSKEEFYSYISTARTCFPLASGLIDLNETYISDGICHIKYLYDEKETKKRINDFINKVSSFIKENIKYDEIDYIKAIELYNGVVNKDKFDKDLVLEDMLKVNPYRAIVENIGICQEIAGEYIYYLLQIGINAITVSALDKNKNEAHEWVLIELDNKYYHCDPTFQINYPDSLYFFAIDDIQRSYYGDFPIENFNYADSDLLNKGNYKADDRRFVDLWLAETYEINHEEKKIYIHNNDDTDLIIEY